MKTSTNAAFVNQLLIGLLVSICFGGSVGLGMVWMRHQISVTADANRVLQQQISEVDRRLADVTALIEEAQSNDVLRRRNVELQLGLVPLKQTQVVSVAEDPMRLLAQRANRTLFGGGDTAASNFQLTLGQ